MAKVKELLKELEGQYNEFEVVYATRSNHHWHCSAIENVSELFKEEIWNNLNVERYAILDIDDLDHTICADGEFYARDLFSEDIQYLIIEISEFDLNRELNKQKVLLWQIKHL